MSSNGGHRYTKTIEAGPTWYDLYRASISIEDKDDWHDKFSLYCIHKKNIISGYTSKDKIEIKGFGSEKIEVHALL